MDYSLVAHELQALADLFGHVLELLRVEHWRAVAIYFLEFVEVDSKALENDYDVLAEQKTVKELNQTSFALIVVLEVFLQLLQNPYLHVCVFNVKFLVLPDFCSHAPALWIFEVDAHHDLAKSSLIENPDHLVAVCELLANLNFVLPLFICDRVLVEPPNSSNCKNSLILIYFYPLQVAELISEKSHGLLRCVAVERSRLNILVK